MKALLPSALLDLRDLDSPPAPPRWLVGGLIERGAVVLFAGDSGAAKSTLALDLAVALAQGRPWLGRSVERGRCIYVDAENDRRLVLRRLHALGLRSGDVGLRYWSRPPLSLSEPAHVAELREEVRQHRPDLLVLDTALSLAGIDANDNTAVAGLFAKVLRRIAEDHGCAVLLTHHEVKAASGNNRGTTGAARAALGAMSWRGQADLHVAVERARSGHGRRVDERGHAHDAFRIRLRLPKLRDGFADGAEVEDAAVVSERDAEGALLWLRVERTGARSGQSRPSAVERIVGALQAGGPYSRSELAAAVEMQPGGGGFKGAVAEALQTGRAVEVGGRLAAGEEVA